MAMLVHEHAAGLTGREARTAFMMSFYGNFQTWISVLTAGQTVPAVAAPLAIRATEGQGLTT